MRSTTTLTIRFGVCGTAMPQRMARGRDRHVDRRDADERHLQFVGDREHRVGAGRARRADQEVDLVLLHELARVLRRRRRIGAVVELDSLILWPSTSA